MIKLIENRQNKLVIKKILDVYNVIPEEFFDFNRNEIKNMANARRIQKLDDFTSAQEIIDYYCKWFNCTPDEFIVVDK